ncbi:MAG: hypothetical protein RI544_03925 [Haloquadratum sp.]|nr:hypothetical protein [Haloquadratum sp.]
MPPSEDEDATTWMDLVDTAIEEEIRRPDAIELTAEDLEVLVPMAFGADVDSAHWRFNGSVTVSVEGLSGGVGEWLRVWMDR